LQILNPDGYPVEKSAIKCAKNIQEIGSSVFCYMQAEAHTFWYGEAGGPGCNYQTFLVKCFHHANEIILWEVLFYLLKSSFVKRSCIAYVLFKIDFLIKAV